MALLWFPNENLMHIDVGQCSFLLLLDLSAAFETAHYSILLSSPQQWEGALVCSASFQDFLSCGHQCFLLCLADLVL